MKIHIGPYRKNKRVSVHIDDYDLWNADNTLAIVIVEVLKRFRSQYTGSPHVDNDDVPDELKMSAEQLVQFHETGETDSEYHKRWEYVLDEMIFAMDFVANAASHYTETEEEDERVNNGLRLFGKYMRALWT
jgi:hypothetical protein